jgi:hypothetical protein
MKFYCLFKICTVSEVFAESSPFGPHDTEAIALSEGEQEARKIAEGFAAKMSPGEEIALTKFEKVKDPIIFNNDGRVH